MGLSATTASPARNRSANPQSPIRNPTIPSAGFFFCSDVCKTLRGKAGCLEACPTGSIVRTESRLGFWCRTIVCKRLRLLRRVRVRSAVIDRRPEPFAGSWRARSSCTFCVTIDKKSGLVPACAKVCPTESIVFWPIGRSACARGAERVSAITREWFTATRNFYDPTETSVRGIHAFFLILGEPRSLRTSAKKPQIPTIYLKSAWTAGGFATAVASIIATPRSVRIFSHDEESAGKRSNQCPGSACVPRVHFSAPRRKSSARKKVLRWRGGDIAGNVEGRATLPQMIVMKPEPNEKATGRITRGKRGKMAVVAGQGRRHCRADQFRGKTRLLRPAGGKTARSGHGKFPLYFFFGRNLGGDVGSHRARRRPVSTMSILHAWRCGLRPSPARVISPILLILDLGRPHLFLNMLRVFQNIARPCRWGGVGFYRHLGASIVAGFDHARIARAIRFFPRRAGSTPALRRLGSLFLARRFLGTLLATYTGGTNRSHRDSRVVFTSHTTADSFLETAGLGCAAALLELFGHRIAALNFLGFYRPLRLRQRF